jgi:hypothetical protein
MSARKGPAGRILSKTDLRTGSEEMSCAVSLTVRRSRARDRAIFTSDSSIPPQKILFPSLTLRPSSTRALATFCLPGYSSRCSEICLHKFEHRTLTYIIVQQSLKCYYDVQGPHQSRGIMNNVEKQISKHTTRSLSSTR